MEPARVVAVGLHRLQAPSGEAHGIAYVEALPYHALAARARGRFSLHGASEYRGVRYHTHLAGIIGSSFARTFSRLTDELAKPLAVSSEARQGLRFGTDLGREFNYWENAMKNLVLPSDVQRLNNVFVHFIHTLMETSEFLANMLPVLFFVGTAALTVWAL